MNSLQTLVLRRPFFPLPIYTLIWMLAVMRLCKTQVFTENKRELLNTPASLRCSLKTSKEVLIVTWQKVKAGSPENMVTFSDKHGVVVQPPYQDKINITQLELKNSTITFWNTTLEDEGCYKCLFNTFGAGTISGETCLTLSVQPTVSLHYKFFQDHLNITCSANARPAPVISWKVSGSGMENSTEILSHPNGTTSVTSILYVKDPKSQVGKEVTCQVLHLGTETNFTQTVNKVRSHFSKLAKSRSRLRIVGESNRTLKLILWSTKYDSERKREEKYCSPRNQMSKKRWALKACAFEDFSLPSKLHCAV
ncbi:OX-2 membrane glycoprotein-like isoform X2 [Talpa occidentalis]|uniref:OX-2 membrane glycoprotein-like isoform X2 n=1 Tax=Talpa occidentalis TaxID=50954 RepID=UPI00188F9E7B|nr:OX-2 membrane glycoprotein-like isoform X2 [Talpa occidentalis]